jgi:hypothetical protein
MPEFLIRLLNVILFLTLHVVMHLFLMVTSMKVLIRAGTFCRIRLLTICAIISLTAIFTIILDILKIFTLYSLIQYLFRIFSHLFSATLWQVGFQIHHSLNAFFRIASSVIIYLLKRLQILIVLNLFHIKSHQQEIFISMLIFPLEVRQQVVVRPRVKAHREVPYPLAFQVWMFLTHLIMVILAISPAKRLLTIILLTASTFMFGPVLFQIFSFSMMAVRFI